MREKTTDVASVFLTVLLVILVVLPPFSWLGSAMGLPVRNLFSGEGIRWFYAHLHESLTTPLFRVVIPVVLVVGAFMRSGLGRLLGGLCRMRQADKWVTYRQRTALLVAGIFFVAYFVAMLLLILAPQAVLLSAMGHIFPSPFAYGMIPVSTLGLQITALIYARLSNHLHGLGESLSVLYWGIRSYAAWIFIAILAAQVLNTITYVFNFSL